MLSGIALNKVCDEGETLKYVKRQCHTWLIHASEKSTKRLFSYHLIKA